ncbi:integral membrane protein [Liquorilactobacillus sucicola DSM 21376 = JCM 15457]|uniref:Integral membrane protein n=1 Tax=Liquorilactobacillus sucicola DSM 21376 = JCM 15457 TaxID=1423806 RepID=A0A0R2DNA7_9LACO|nr:cadmium resistance transporter [Liquorilactobacillus sucicola]KRN05586.1 integral membrane protein [Liquorilactobacillus sucicola DSM 21376 = JCM 15457]
MNYGILTVTFLSVNLDFFFMLLFLLKKYRFIDVLAGYLIGILLLLVISYCSGRILTSFLPEWILGVLGILPIYLALHDDTDDDIAKKSHSPILNVLLTYLAVCAGCNLAIFLPVLVGVSYMHFGLTLLFIGVLTILAVITVDLITNISAVTSIMRLHGASLMKICYIGIGCYVFWDSGLIAHLSVLF